MTSPSYSGGTLSTISTMEHHSVKRKIEESFRRLGYPQLNDIRCRVEEDTVILEGELQSYYLNQIAEASALKASGVSEVDNRIVIR